MKLLTEAEQVRTAAERWRQAYEQPAGWVTMQDGRASKPIYEELCRVDVAARAGDIAAIIGDDRLVHTHSCVECGQKFWRCVEFPGGVVLCAGCMCRGLSAALGVGSL